MTDPDVESQTPDEWVSDGELDAEMEAEIWQMYCTDAPLQMASILEACAAGDINRVGKVTHRLAGDSGAVGCVRVEVTGRELERAAATPDIAITSLTLLVHSLEQALTEAMAAPHGRAGPASEGTVS